MSLPDGLTSRNATKIDAPAIASVINACEAAHVSEPIRVGEREVGMWLGRTSSAIVVCEDAEIAAFAGAVRRGRTLSAEAAVLPTATGRGIGSFLLDWSEERGREQDADAVRASILAADEAARRLVVARGYAYVRSFYRMVIDLREPPSPEWPAGITATPLAEGEERMLHEVVEETFAEHWGHVHRSFEEWLAGIVIEPDLIFFARQDEEVAGAVICNEDLYGVALVAILGIRKRWRGQGLGRALLLQGSAPSTGRASGGSGSAWMPATRPERFASTRASGCVSLARKTCTRSAANLPSVSRLRAKCPYCKTFTAVAIGSEYECHACGADFAAGLVRVPRAWGRGGEAMVEAALLELPYPEAALVDEESLHDQNLVLASELPERPLVLGGCCCAHVGAVEGLAARWAGSPCSGSTRTAT